MNAGSPTKSASSKTANPSPKPEKYKRLLAQKYYKQAPSPRAFGEKKVAHEKKL